MAAMDARENKAPRLRARDAMSAASAPAATRVRPTCQNHWPMLE